MIAGIGVDIVAIARLERAPRRTPPLATRLFTPAEQAWAAGRETPAASLAVPERARHGPGHEELEQDTP